MKKDVNMGLLFKRSQTTDGRGGDVVFKLWCKVEFSEEEQKLVSRYRMYDAVVVDEVDNDTKTGLIKSQLPRKSRVSTKAVILLLAVVFAVVFAILFLLFGPSALGLIISLIAIGIVAFFVLPSDAPSETVYVRDLVHGREFICHSVMALTEREAWLLKLIKCLRQVLESAKHWDGKERIGIEPPARKKAKRSISRVS